MSQRHLIKLLAGFKRFKGSYFEDGKSVYERLAASGQSPKILVIGCSDSRVDPALLASAGPGDLFVVRNVANLVPPFETTSGFHGVSSAIEFAVVGLKVETVVLHGGPPKSISMKECPKLAELRTSSFSLRIRFLLF